MHTTKVVLLLLLIFLAIKLIVLIWHWLLLLAAISLVVCFYLKAILGMKKRGFESLAAIYITCTVMFMGLGLGFSLQAAYLLMTTSSSVLLGTVLYPHIRYHLQVADYKSRFKKLPRP